MADDKDDDLVCIHVDRNELSALQNWHLTRASELMFKAIGAPRNIEFAQHHIDRAKWLMAVIASAMEGQD